MEADTAVEDMGEEDMTMGEVTGTGGGQRLSVGWTMEEEEVDTRGVVEMEEGAVMVEAGEVTPAGVAGGEEEEEEEMNTSSRK